VLVKEWLGRRTRARKLAGVPEEMVEVAEIPSKGLNGLGQDPASKAQRVLNFDRVLRAGRPTEHD
jgi:hypothetical protein